MKLLLLTDWTFPCDHSILSGVYSDELTKRGYDLVWVMRPENEQNGIQKREWNGNPVYILPQNAYSPINTVSSSILGTLDEHPLNKVVNQHPDIDLIQTRNDLAMGVVGSNLADQLDIPYLHRVSHTKAESMMYEAKKGFAPRKEFIKGKLGKKLRERICTQSDYVLSISDEMTRYLQRTYEGPIEEIPTGADENLSPKEVDGKQFRKEYSIPLDTNIVLYIGSIAESRHLDFLLDAFTEVLKEKEAQLVMIGGRSQEDRNRLRDYAREKGISDGVLFTGWISEDTQLQRAIHTADVGTSPIPPWLISYKTSSPLKLHEYLNLQTPVVGTKIPDQQFVIEKSEGGYITEYDKNEFSEAIVSILDSEHQMETMGKSGREFVTKHRSYSVLADKLDRIYSSA